MPPLEACGTQVGFRTRARALCTGQMEEAGPSGGKSPNSPRLGQLRELWQLRPHETQPLTHLYLRQPVSEKLVPALKVLNSKKEGGQ